MKKIIFTLFAAGFTNLVSAAVPPLKTQIVASGFDRPLFATAPNGDSRLFVVEQGGLVKSCKMERCCRPHSLICQLRSTLPASAAFWE